MASAATGLVLSLAEMSGTRLEDVRSLGDVLQRYAEDMAGICGGPPAQGGCYRRSLLYRTDRFEVLLLRWGRGAVSPVHDHARQTCVFTVLRGDLTVDDYELDAARRKEGVFAIHQTGSFSITPGMLDYRKGELDIHQVRCRDEAVSLHVYAAPIALCGIYDPQSSRRMEQSLHYDDIRADLLAL
jgi:predicted metal-dependent enzyme (double-stranded beta helix superfamily)